ncbi:hypothetical protein ANAPC3_01411 [Anaplasma phagocytophilum]|nr:hypothetical protein ANAPC3_01411 [Anaplasma phagocytophilum]
MRACGLVHSERGERQGLTAETGLNESVTSTGRVCVRGAWRAQERERGMT